MEARMEQLAQANLAANSRLTTLTDEVKELQGRLKSSTADLDAFKTNIAEFKNSMELIDDKLAMLNHPTSTSKIEVVNKEASPTDTHSADQDAYMQAFGMFSTNNYSGAIDAFELFIKTFPESDNVANALYWLGECHYAQHNYNEAMEVFSKVITTFPSGNKVPDAMLMTGYTLLSMSEPAKAKESLQSLMEKYPNSQAAAKARERLARLSK